VHQFPWQKRIKILGIDTTQFTFGYSVPQAEIINRDNIAFDYDEQQLTIRIIAKDSVSKLDRINLLINNVQLFGQRGISLRERNIYEFDTTISLILSVGINKIETSVLNVNGIESYRIPLYAQYNPKTMISEKLYFIGIGIDRYQQKGYDLQYSVKDIRDLISILKEKYDTNIYINTLFNEQATSDNILSLKKILLQTSVNDKVIISFSGHGVLDKQYDFFLSTYTLDFLNPSNGGIPYSDIDWLLDSIPARKKLLLIDACHSGEVDKEEMLAIRNNTAKNVKGAKVSYTYKPKLGMKNSFELMQELFSNLNKGTGATVISAAAGTQFAYEKEELSNGVFTYSILELMKTKPEMTVNQLKAAVGKRVEELTNGLQKPTSRVENLEFDWRVW